MRWTDDLSRRNSLHSRKILPFDEAPPLSSTPRTINNLQSFETGPLPRIKRLPEDSERSQQQQQQQPQPTPASVSVTGEQTPPSNGLESTGSIERIKKIFMLFEPKGCLKERDDYSLYLFPKSNRYFLSVLFFPFFSA